MRVRTTAYSDSMFPHREARVSESSMCARQQFMRFASNSEGNPKRTRWRWSTALLDQAGHHVPNAKRGPMLTVLGTALTAPRLEADRQREFAPDPGPRGGAATPGKARRKPKRDPVRAFGARQCARST